MLDILNSSVVDSVQVIVLYKDCNVNFYHGFDQTKILDRQELRLLFERGEVTLYEWVPVKMKLHGLVDRPTMDILEKVVGKFETVQSVKTQDHKSTGRFKEIKYDNHITIKYGSSSEKQERYEQLLTSLLTDQWN